MGTEDTLEQGPDFDLSSISNEDAAGPSAAPALRIVGVRLRAIGGLQLCDGGELRLQKGDRIVVETESGPGVGKVVTDGVPQRAECPLPRLLKVIRIATGEEIHASERARVLERQVYEYSAQKIKEMALPMALVCAERQFDGSKVVVYFTADGRIDFRELVKDLGRRFRMRIEMRQIGVRQQAKMVEGLGVCGRALCCATFLNNFAPVTIKMAKDQNISLNPGKISGMCGRLMCCLSYEHAYYARKKKDLPGVGKKVTTKDGPGKVIRQNLMRDTLTVQLDTGGEAEIAAREFRREGFFKKKPK